MPICLSNGIINMCMKVTEIFDDPFFIGDNPDTRKVIKSVKVIRVNRRGRWPDFRSNVFEWKLIGVDLIGDSFTILSKVEHVDVPHEAKNSIMFRKNLIESGLDLEYVISPY